MLHKNKSNRFIHSKFAIIGPLLIAFVMNFNPRLFAQQSTPHPEKVVIIKTRK